MQLLLAMFWAASWPVAMKMAVTMLAAWALKPPMLPAMAEPVRFLAMLRSQSADVVVLSVVSMMSPGMMAWHVTDLPRPSIQLMAAGFLSVQTLPLRLRI